MEGKVFIITGASTGIGEAAARRAVEAGFNVVLAARSTGKLERLKQELGPGKALAVTCDVADWASQQEMVNRTIDRFGRIDAVFANAGFSNGSPFLG
ncbi:MAG: SDR family NAD(P)-dependent oxidoreductase, partial [Chlorobiaceae bacterium]|nr:SDR family NAD(P)-dependent oxidoreductase [Chlorobiaceae bacterium]